jgi:hypothetical protein
LYGYAGDCSSYYYSPYGQCYGYGW